MELGNKIFGEKRNWWNPLETYQWLKANYDYRGMSEGLKLALGEDTTVGSEKIKTGLCIVAKRADTNSIWPIINHPRGKYYDRVGSKNRDLFLWKVVRASTAAPTYFAPQLMEVKTDQPAAFIDGGLSMANNPALTLLMVATLKGFPFRWPMGADNLLLVSLGTGYPQFKKHVGEIDESTMLTWAANIPDMLMQDASWQNRLLLQWLSNSPTAEVMDSEIGDMNEDMISGTPLLSYLRYNFAITKDNLNGLGFDAQFSDRDVIDIADMARAKNKELLYEIGYKASTVITPEHFANF
jgi:patatin-like phospholipase/acyl hydrolase